VKISTIKNQEVIYLVFIAIGVLFIWTYALNLRMAYLDQIPVYDADVTTSAMVMWARGWLIEGPLNIWLSTPFQPSSIEMPTLLDRGVYQSWPPGAVLPIYISSLFLEIEPSAVLINWVNTFGNIILSFAVAYAAWNLCIINRVNSFAAVILAIASSLPVILPRGIAYIFSQIYCVTTAILPYIAICIFLETAMFRTKSNQKNKILLILFLIVIFFAFFVDWLAYTFFIFWFLYRLIGCKYKFFPEWTSSQKIKIGLLPIIGMGIYLFWRIGTPGSEGERHGFLASLNLLFEKVLNRINLGNDRISNFWEAFIEIHNHWFSPHLLYLLISTLLLSLALFIYLLLKNKSHDERRNIFFLIAILLLVTIPFYLQMIIFSQHTFIHRWAIAKIIFAYAFVPFVILPLGLLKLQQVFTKRKFLGLINNYLAVPVSIIILLFAGISSSQFNPPYLMGRIDMKTYQTFNTIHNNTGYADVLFSPVWEAPPIGMIVGITNKRIYKIKSFSEIDSFFQKRNLSGKANVVIVMPSNKINNKFDKHIADEVFFKDGLLLLRYHNYSNN
jgi:hypothetical protein